MSGTVEQPTTDVCHPEQSDPQLRIQEARAAKSTSPVPRSVLHILDHSFPVLSGYAVRSRNLISAQRGLGESIQVLTSPLHQTDDPSATELELDGVQYCRTPIHGRFAAAAIGRRFPLLREFEVVKLLRERVTEMSRALRPSVIYAHSPSLCGLAGLQAARKLRLPFVYEIRAFWEDAAPAGTKRWRLALTHKLETYVARNADAVSAIALPMLEDLKARGIPDNKLFHVPNGVDTNRFQPVVRDESLACELGLKERPVFGFFGSLYGYEGVSWMIRAVSQLRPRGHRFGVLIIGKGDDESEIRRAIHECSAADYVRTLDHVPHDQIARYYSVVDIMVCPRRSSRLTELVTPLKPLEAMAHGKPVLASAVGGIRELVEHDRTGLLYPAEDRSGFCEQAERMISSESLRKSLAESGRAFVVEKRDWKILARRYRQIYDFVLLSKRSV